MSNIENMTRAELLALAKERGMTGLTQLKKEEIEAAIRESMAKEADAGAEPAPEAPDAPNADDASTEDADAPDAPNADLPPGVSVGVPVEPELDDEESREAVTVEQAHRISTASTESLMATVEMTKDPYRAAIKRELKRRDEARAEAEKKNRPMEMMKVVDGGPIYSSGFLTDVPPGAIVTESEGNRLEGLGMKVVPCKVRLVRDAMGVPRLEEV